MGVFRPIIRDATVEDNINGFINFKFCALNEVGEISLKKGQIGADAIYNPLETKWLKTGGERGAKTIGGLDMFIGQGLASADIWFGEKISEKIKLEPIKKVLKSELC